MQHHIVAGLFVLALAIAIVAVAIVAILDARRK
jgi:hypothetical protein